MKKSLLLSLLVLSLHSISQIPTNGLVGFYPFNANANDESGNANDGIVFGATLTTDRFGIPNNAYSLNGTDNYIDLSNNAANFNKTEVSSLSFWIKSNTDVAQSIFSISNATGVELTTVYIGNATSSLTDEIILTAHGCSVDKYIAGFTSTQKDTLLDNNWHHIVILCDNISSKIYLDNIMVSISCTYGTNNGHFGNIATPKYAVIGTRYANSAFGAFYKGAIDDIRFYDRVLTSNEISSLYNEIVTTEPIITDNRIVTVYPNPTKSSIEIDLNKLVRDKNGYTISIQNALNQTIYNKEISSQITSIELSSIASKGIYFIKISDKNSINISTSKVILE